MCIWEWGSVSQLKASLLSEPTFSGTRRGEADVMSVSFCSWRPHSVRAPEQPPRERLRHRRVLLHKQTHKVGALAHFQRQRLLRVSSSRSPKSSARGHFSHSPSRPQLIQIPLVIFFFLNNTAWNEIKKKNRSNRNWVSILKCHQKKKKKKAPVWEHSARLTYVRKSSCVNQADGERTRRTSLMASGFSADSCARG